MLEFFLLNPSKKLRVRQIERELKIPLHSAIKYKEEFIDEKILKKIEIEDIIFFQADTFSKKYILEKRLFNIRMLYDSGLIDYLIEEYGNPVIIVFGPYSRGEDIENTEIGIYIEGIGNMVKLEKFEKILQRKIKLYNYNNVQSTKNQELVNNIVNGIVLNSFIDVYKKGKESLIQRMNLIPR